MDIDIEQLKPFIPVITSFLIGMLGGWYIKFKKILKALNKALEDDKLTEEELKAIYEIIRR